MKNQVVWGGNGNILNVEINFNVDGLREAKPSPISNMIVFMGMVLATGIFVLTPSDNTGSAFLNGFTPPAPIVSTATYGGFRGDTSRNDRQRVNSGEIVTMSAYNATELISKPIIQFDLSPSNVYARDEIVSSGEVVKHMERQRLYGELKKSYTTSVATFGTLAAAGLVGMLVSSPTYRPIPSVLFIFALVVAIALMADYLKRGKQPDER